MILRFAPKMLSSMRTRAENMGVKGKLQLKIGHCDKGKCQRSQEWQREWTGGKQLLSQGGAIWVTVFLLTE